MNAYHPRVSALVWLLGMILLAAQGFQTLQRDWLETGFLALLPKVEQRPEVAEAVEHYNQSFNRKLIWLYGAANADAAIAGAKQLSARVKGSGLFTAVTLQTEQDAERYRRLFDARYQLLDRDTQQRLETNPQDLLAENLALLYGPAGQLQAALLERDPLMLFSRYLAAQQPKRFRIEQGIVTVREAERTWALLQADLDNSQLPLDKLASLKQLVEEANTEAQAADGELLVSGLPLFTAYGADAAKHEISTVGVFSSVGIVLLFLLTFRSIKPLLLSALAIAGGLAAALIVSVELFGKVHIITLVFGASLIGVVDDYAQHYLCDSLGDRYWTPRRGLAAIFPALLVGLIVNLLSYAGLGFSEFPGLQQIAVFSALGLFSAWLTVVMAFPFLLGGFRFAHEPMLLKAALFWEQRWPAWIIGHRRWIGLTLLAVIAGGLCKLTPRDDVRLLQSAPPALLQAGEKIQHLLGVRDSRFFLVSGNGLDEWHRNEQRLLAQLDAQVERGALQSYEALGRHWPDAEGQQRNYRLIKHALIDSGLAERYLHDLGFEPRAAQAFGKSFADAESHTIGLDEWLAASDAGKRTLWLGCAEGRCAAIVALTGIREPAALAALRMPGVAWVDHVDALSELFARSRERASLLLAAAFTLAAIGLTVHFGWRGAMTLMSIPLLSALSALALTGWFDQLFSLFNLFALLLVLGIGVDYATFFYLAGERRASTSLAVTLSALTTLLSFGLLALSSTEIVHAFGFTVAIGIATAMLAAPIIGIAGSRR